MTSSFGTDVPSHVLRSITLDTRLTDTLAWRPPWVADRGGRGQLFGGSGPEGVEDTHEAEVSAAESSLTTNRIQSCTLMG
jgi:hypothetical protein